MLIIGKTAHSQLNPMGSIYYQNQYLANPAMAGVKSNWELNAAYKSQWSAIDGAPNMQMLSATYGSESKKAGFGLLFFNDKAGVVKTMSIKATYAYHLTLNGNNSFIDFGLSAGMLDEWVNRGEVVGDISDVSLSNFNDRKLSLDADFGLAFRNKGLTLQGTLPNLRRYLKKEIERNLVDRSLYMAALSYKFANEDRSLTTIEPKIAFRGVDNYKNIVDVGVNFEFSGDKLMLSSVYHTSGSITFGAGTTYKKQLAILCQYTTNTNDLSSYANGEAEIAVRYSFK
ncbi:type IX secretion system membrane protein, PorP/SprF family [Pedobacter xixiisoli]|uniref:Type IX secretion system membrane protein, PorP/SprF family n=2 Tax=Pedobacter xixiisoli TaxID=1476464 RepID=A0A286A7U9_9SPHI|nr:type IX secretion system membrane protein, PorP/SprF family [Pedobacter xixiisoli]